MFTVTLLDGTQKKYDNAISIRDIAHSISPGLLKSAVAGEVDGIAVNLNYIINKDVALKIITIKDNQGLEVLRHSCAHLLAQAVKELYPETKVAIGPVIENGFYYDFSCKKPFTPDDLLLIENKMKELAKAGDVVSCRAVSKAEAIEFFSEINETYKVEIIKDLDEDKEITLYTQGNFTDLCLGPHVPNTNMIKVFKLMHVAGSYWRGDSKNEMLQRIYATCWATKQQLEDHLFALSEAEKRDHRKIGKALDLFHFEEESPGITYWHPNGNTIWRTVEDYMRASNIKFGCTEIRTPLIADFSLWEKSGHADKYSDDMFTTSSENRDFAIRPMNCPMCVQVFNSNHHSYRDLPVRMAEFGVVHRNESSGSLHGLMRVRSFTQDDGHVFCTEDQIEKEVITMVEQSFEVYKDFGFTDFVVKIALRPDDRIGSDDVWDKAEKILASALNKNNVEFEYLPGEGAFYGPKIEFHLKDSLKRSWQCGTIQLDFSMPERLGASYIDENSNKKTPVMIHRAIVGSLERFIGMLIENYAGKLPVWLSPTQVVALGISNNNDEYIKNIVQNLKKVGIRARFDLRNEKIGFKIRESILNRSSFIIVVGDKEQETNTISVRKQNGEDLGVMNLDSFIDFINNEINNKCV